MEHSNPVIALYGARIIIEGLREILESANAITIYGKWSKQR